MDSLRTWALVKYLAPSLSLVINASSTDSTGPMGRDTHCSWSSHVMTVLSCGVIHPIGWQGTSLRDCFAKSARLNAKVARI